MKQFFSKLTVIFSSCILLSGCLGKFIGNRLGLFEKQATLIKFSNQQKEIVYIPMHHVGETSFFKDVTHQLDSLQQLGYVVFYEGVAMSKSIDSLKRDTIFKKARKLLGRSPSKPYIGEDGEILGKKFKALKDLVNQPKGLAIGIDSTTGKNVDVSIDDVVLHYENKYGRIVLDSCDLQTPINDEYHCSKLNDRDAKLDVILNFRNNHIFDKILESTSKKIVVLYGARHFEGVFKLLHQNDPNWALDPNAPAEYQNMVKTTP